MTTADHRTVDVSGIRFFHRVETRHETDSPHQRINDFAKPNGAGVNGPGGARLINATKNSATIASQKDSQKPSM